MATIEEYQNVAPTIMALGEFTVTQIENKLSTIPEPPSPADPPTITKQNVIDIFNLVFAEYSADVGIAKAKGYNAIAKQFNLWPTQVKKIVSELKAMKAVYDREQ